MSGQSQTPPNPMDAAAAFWKDAWQKMATSMPGGAMPGMPAVPAMNPADPSTWMPSPDAVRRMQTAFLDAMASFAEQYMRSPQFLEAMKRSMDQALDLRQKMEQMMKANLSSAFDTASGGSASDVMTAIRELDSKLNTKLETLADRLDAIEGKGTDRPARKTAKR